MCPFRVAVSPVVEVLMLSTCIAKKSGVVPGLSSPRRPIPVLTHHPVRPVRPC